MKRISIKNVSFLGLILMTTSTLIAAVVPNKGSVKAPNDGTLRQFSATVAGADQDAAQGVISCIPDADTVYSCTASIGTGTTTVNTSRDENGLQTDGNTSITAAFSGEQTSAVI